MTRQSEQEFFDHSYDTNARARVGQVYSIIHGRNRRYEELIYSGVEGLRVLEYGCGEGSHSLGLARRGAEVVGIDISEVGIRNATASAAAAGLSNAQYLVMDAENMTFESNSFDVVIGEGILHHLDLATSYREVARVLKPTGRAVFMEPLGHNLAINLFRKMTPRLRTADEHPLVRRDLTAAAAHFGKSEFCYFHLTSFASLIFLKTPLFFRTVNWLDKVDSLLFRAVPPIGTLAWYVIMVLSEPRPENA